MNLKKLKKLISQIQVLLIVLTFVLSSGTMSVYAEESEQTVISIDSISACPGDDISVNINIKNNIGILGATLELEYAPELSLTGATAGEAFSYLTFSKPGSFTSPCRFVWDGQELGENVSDGVILTLDFHVSENATPDSSLDIALDIPRGDIYDNDLNVVEATTQNGSIRVIDFRPGDVNSDGKINVIDIATLRRYLVGGFDISVSENASNVNDDGRVNTADIILLRRYLAGGYNVSLIASTHIACNHELVSTAYKAASCTEEGNIAFWKCSLCGQYFSDKNANHEITFDNTIIPATGHTIVYDEAVEPTATTPGLTEGQHCAVCGEIIIPQVEYGLTEYTVTYNIANGDTYLEKQEILNVNPMTFTEYDTVDLEDLSVPGYRFLGWYDGAGNNATHIKTIEAGTKKNLNLYAHWEKIEYTITYDAQMRNNKDSYDSTYDVPSVKYTIDTGAKLADMSGTASNYVFVGWADEEGNFFENNVLPAGLHEYQKLDQNGNPVYDEDGEIEVVREPYGNITLYGIWISERYKPVANATLGNPIIYEDDSVILFAYNIGEIQNIPLATIEDWGYISGDGVSRTVDKSYSVSTSESMMNAYMHAVEDSTTKSSSWVLSNGWNEGITINESWMRENGLTETEAERVSKSKSNNWNVSSGSSGSASTVSLNNTQTDQNTSVKIGNSSTNSNTSTTNHSAQLDTNVGVAANVSTKFMGVGAEIDTNVNIQSGLSSGVSNETGRSNTGVVDYNHGENTTKLKSTSATSSSSWNSSSSRGGSSTVTNDKEISSSLSEKISKAYGYGKNYIQTQNRTETQGESQTTSSSDEYSSQVTYSKEEVTEEDYHYSTVNTKPGYHRLVLAGTAHVFGVVGYDIASSAYFVYTYSVMDDATYDMEDYSYSSASYDDRQNGVLPFEIPDDVEEYVLNRTAASAGLKVDASTGIITRYTGTDDAVIIPEYINISNGDGTTSVVKVTGISESALKGNTSIKAVVLSDFIKEIPDNAFSGCTNLIGVSGESIEKIGKNAFSGCVSFEWGMIGEQVTSLGTNAFDGVKELYIYAANKDVAVSAVESGAKNIVLNLDKLNDSTGNSALSGVDLIIPEGTELFALNGFDGVFNETKIRSDAKTTIINRANINCTGAVPLRCSSESVYLNQTSLDGSGLSMVLTADNTRLGLQNQVSVSTNGTNAVLCKSIELYESNDVAIGQLNVSGKLLYCGEIVGKELLNCPEENQIRIDEITFENMLSTYTLYYNANGGICEVESVQVSNATAIGEMPIPEKQGYIFDGWYLSDGTLVDSDTVFSSGEDVTVFAHWVANAYTVKWDNGVGYTIAVKRTASPEENASIGYLTSGTAVYYGDVLEITYSASTGFTLSQKGKTSITVSQNVTSSDIYAKAIPNSYKVSWSTGTGYSIAVNRTSSAYGNAAIGILTSGAVIYYGDIINVTYTAANGYKINSKGLEKITVTGNVTSSNIYATATPNSYTYNVVYKSSNGTSLGSTTISKQFGTTNTISAPAKTGYVTPSSQSIKWDSTSAKTITFTYKPESVSTSQSVASGTWRTWKGSSGTSYSIKYAVTAEYKNRTASSIQVRLKWVNSIDKNCYYGYAQYFTGKIGGTSTGQKTICSASTWGSMSSSARSQTVYSDWITVKNLTGTSHTVTLSATWKDGNSVSGSWSKTMKIPTY